MKLQVCDEPVRRIGLSQQFDYSVTSKGGGRMSERKNNIVDYKIPLWLKPTLSIAEAAIYSGISSGKLYELTAKEKCPFVLWVNSKRMIRRKAFVEYLEKHYSI